MTELTIVTHRKRVEINNESRTVTVSAPARSIVQICDVGLRGPPGPESDPVTIDLALLYQVSKL